MNIKTLSLAAAIGTSILGPSGAAPVSAQDGVSLFKVITVRDEIVVGLSSTDLNGSGGAREQLSGISQINSAVAQLDGITQQNAAAVEQIAAASMNLASHAQQVANTVQVFLLDAQDKARSVDAVALRKQIKASS